MREHGTIPSEIWRNGDLHRLGPEARLLACYLLSCPSSQAIGLYYLPVPIIAHELGFSDRRTIKVLDWLRRLPWPASLLWSAWTEPRSTGPSTEWFCLYDYPTSTVWVTNMAAMEFGARMEPTDTRLPAVRRDLAQMSGSPLAPLFMDRYGEAFSLRAPPAVVTPEPAEMDEAVAPGMEASQLRARARLDRPRKRKPPVLGLTSPDRIIPNEVDRAEHPIRYLLTYFERAYIMRQQPPLHQSAQRHPPFGGKEATHAERMLKHYGLAQTLAFVDAFFQCDTRFLREAGYGFNIFTTQIGMVIARSQGAQAGMHADKTRDMMASVEQAKALLMTNRSMLRLNTTDIGV